MSSSSLSHSFPFTFLKSGCKPSNTIFAFVVPSILLILTKSPFSHRRFLQHPVPLGFGGTASLCQELVAAVQKRTGVVATDGHSLLKLLLPTSCLFVATKLTFFFLIVSVQLLLR
ncbi:unnamed protein product [Tilletia caries]|uniref:Uncharacterized protein n=1 Tax=Tilletia caries TaxID=13290 RepID=A0ABN7J1W3_9BASI|nr:unnamed protein product [Tilletia caries]